MRQSGRTTKQMLNAPRNAVFIWCNNQTFYAKCLAIDIGRGDLRIVSPNWLRDAWRGRTFSGIIVDHAARLSIDENAALDEAMTRVRHV